MSAGESHSPEAGKLYERLKAEAEAAGYFLNPDEEFVLDLMEGLLTNEERYGYWACPCRLADGERQTDLDIICPCDYRDPDVDEYGACYCALYVSEEVAKGGREAEPVTERRGTPAAEGWGPARKGEGEVAEEHTEELAGFTSSGIPVWRCTVCGYLCARPEPPLKCPVCKVDKDRFERFA